MHCFLPNRNWWFTLKVRFTAITDLSTVVSALARLPGPTWIEPLILASSLAALCSKTHVQCWGANWYRLFRKYYSKDPSWAGISNPIILSSVVPVPGLTGIFGVLGSPCTDLYSAPASSCFDKFDSRRCSCYFRYNYSSLGCRQHRALLIGLY